MLNRINLKEVNLITYSHIWQNYILVIGICHGINGCKAGKFHLGASGLQSKFFLNILGLTVIFNGNSKSVKYSRYHLAGHKALPNELIQLKLVLAEIFFNLLWYHHGTGRANSLMGILGLLPNGVNIGFGGIILFAEVFKYIFLGLLLCLL